MFLDSHEHYGLKWGLLIITTVYMLYKVMIWQILYEIPVVNATLLFFLLVVYPVCMLFTSKYFKEVRFGEVKIFNFHTFWLIYLGCCIYYSIYRPNEIIIEFCLIYCVISYIIAYAFEKNVEAKSQ